MSFLRVLPELLWLCWRWLITWEKPGLLPEVAKAAGSLLLALLLLGWLVLVLAFFWLMLFGWMD